MSPEQRSFRSMGVDVVVGGARDDELEAIEGLFDRWDRVFSRFRPDSELSHVNREEARALVVSRLFASVLRDALAAAAATDGLVIRRSAALSRRPATTGTSFRCRPQRAAAEPDPSRQLAIDLPLGQAARASSRTLLDLKHVVKALAVDAALDLVTGDGFQSKEQNA